jgi:transcriptional regulator of heat shock response
MSRNEPKRDVVSPEQLAELIAGMVNEKIKDTTTAAMRAIKETSRRTIDEIFATANHMAAEMTAAIKKEGEDSRARTLGAFKEFFPDFVRVMKTNLEIYREDLHESRRKEEGLREKAAIQTLTSIIGKEVKDYELEEMIRAALRDAVFEALRVGRARAPGGDACVE